MQGRNRIATRVDRLNQIQFRRQNLPRGKSTFRFHQVRRILHRRFQRRQIHFAQALRQGHVQQFMLLHHRLALEHMGDGMIQGLVFWFKDTDWPDGLD